MSKKIEDSFVKALKEEWKIFWESLKAEPEKIKPATPLEIEKLQSLSLEDVRRLSRSLSTHRRRLNQELEFLRSEIDQHSAKLETQPEHSRERTLRYLNDLNDRGHAMSTRLAQLDSHLKETRRREDELVHSGHQQHRAN
jgi:sulfite reductase alpha subunit-like flavoprotein